MLQHADGAINSQSMLANIVSIGMSPPVSVMRIGWG